MSILWVLINMLHIRRYKEGCRWNVLLSLSTTYSLWFTITRFNHIIISISMSISIAKFIQISKPILIFNFNFQFLYLDNISLHSLHQYHYQHLAGELPVLLSLPEILRDTEGRHHLTSLARLAKG